VTKPLWTPSPARVEASRIAGFIRQVNDSRGLSLQGYDELWQWSVDHIEDFWEEVWRAADPVVSQGYDSVLEDGDEMMGSRWFPGARLNFAENLLRHHAGERAEKTAVSWQDETGRTRSLTHAELYSEVSCMAAFLEDQGVFEGDVVAVYLPNRIEALITMLGAAAIGATFTSCSPDFGYQGVLDRFGQTEPKVLVTCDGYYYNGHRYDILKRVQELLLDIYTIERVVLVPVVHENPSRAGLRGALLWREAMEREPAEIHFAQRPFDHPLYILYSSGTTGKPKCIVHGQGGTLLQHWKEHALHCDIGPDDVVFYFTTTGWMMWNWLMSALQIGSCIVLYDGSPSQPDLHVLWKLADEQRITVFGTSPKFLASCAKAGLEPGEEHDLSALRALLSTGAPLSPELFEWVYSHVKEDLLLASISGGTDIISCFMGGSPVSPVYPGEIQKRSLGMAIAAFDASGEAVVGQQGELVCTRSFPSMPVYFWNDRENRKYHAAYFEHFPGVWRHGDWIEVTEHGGVVVYGRSDATLNPGGVRIGTAEIYRPVQHLPEVLDSVVVGHKVGDDVEVVLFVVLREGQELDDALSRKIRDVVRKSASPRHVPAKIIQAPGVPRTLSGKKVEIAVSRTLQGQEVTNREALANPKILDWYETVDLD